MKNNFLLLLATGISACAYTQIEVSDKLTSPGSKWITMPSKSKNAPGHLMMNFPKGTVWTIYIYKLNGDYITSYANVNNPGYISLPPGEYNITLNNAPIDNVPVKKGNDTELMTGTLDITENEVWYLYDESQQKSYTSGNKPEKLVLPVGNYSLEVNGIHQIVTVKEENTGKKQANRPVIDAEKWILIPMEKQPELTPEQNFENVSDICNLPILVRENELDKAGTLFLDYEGSFPLYVYLAMGDTYDIRCSKNSAQGSCACPRSYTLKEGTYDLRLNNYWIRDVPIKANYETRLKTGRINSTLDVPWGSYNMTKDSSFGIKSAVPVPVGTYMIFDNSRYIKVSIKDKQSYNLLPPPKKTFDMQKDSAWIVRPAFVKNQQSASGRLKLGIEAGWDWSLSWIPPGDNRYSQSVGNTNVAVPSITLDAGVYTFRFSGVTIPGVSILTGMETKIRYGYLDLRPLPDNTKWILLDRYNLGKPYASSYENKRTLVLPANIYILKIGDGLTSEYFFVAVGDGKTTVFDLL